MKKLNNYSIVFVCLFLSSTVNSSLFGQCLEIESILVDACGSPEGENEMVRFRVGSIPLNTADMTVNWPNNSWLGICQNATTTSAVSALNATIQSCGLLIEPIGGILPANAQVLLVTSTAIDVTANSFANLSDTIYIIFQCAGNTSGHFANWSTPTGLRTLTINFSSPIGCIDQVTYDKVLLVNQMGAIGGSAAIRDGALANFNAFGNVMYENFGCQAPFTPSSISISALTTVNVCPENSIQVFATTMGSISSLNWQGNNGTFNTLTNDTVIYTLSLNDTTNFYIVVEGTASCGTIKDSILISINPPVSSTDVQTACNSYTWIDSIIYTVSTNIPKDTLVAANGCDSVVTLNLTINNSTTATDIQTACNSYTWIDGNVYTSSTNTPKDTLVAANGCDSIVTLNLTINTFVSSTDIQTACNSYTWIDGNTYTASTNIPTDTLVAANGCDSVVTLNLTINQPILFNQSFNECQGFSVTVGSNTYNSTGSFIDTLFTVNGCDSIVTTNLTINPTATSTDVQATCNSLTWIDGINYTANTNTPTFTMVGGSSTGCDSVVTLNLTINQPVSFNQSFTECQGFSITVGGNTYNSTGIYIDTLIGAAQLGCDSIVTTDLTINQPVSSNQSFTECQGFSITVGSNTYSSTGIYNDTLTSLQTGCDSVVTTNLSINQAVSFNQSFTECQGFSITVGSNTYSSTDIYNDTLTSLQTGCDSVVTTNLTINQAVSFNQSFTECQGFSITVGSNTYNSTGIYNDTLTAIQTGCDSIITTNLSINQPVAISIIENDTTICLDEFTNGLMLHVSGGGINLIWSTGEVNVDSILVTQDGVVSVTSTNNGCIVQDNINVIINDCIIPTIIIPNVFTPNADNMNDIFKVEGTNISGLEGQIFNRWGEQLYAWNRVDGYWDGRTDSGKDCPDGTYFYIINVKYSDLKKETLTGTVTLLK